MLKAGKPLTPTTKPKVKRDKLTAAERNRLIDDLLTKLGYLTD